MREEKAHSSKLHSMSAGKCKHFPEMTFVPFFLSEPNPPFAPHARYTSHVPRLGFVSVILFPTILRGKKQTREVYCPPSAQLRQSCPSCQQANEGVSLKWHSGHFSSPLQTRFAGLCRGSYALPRGQPLRIYTSSIGPGSSHTGSLSLLIRSLYSFKNVVYR